MTQTGDPNVFVKLLKAAVPHAVVVIDTARSNKHGYIDIRFDGKFDVVEFRPEGFGIYTTSEDEVTPFDRPNEFYDDAEKAVRRIVELMGAG